MSEAPTAERSVALQDPAYLAAVVDFLGAIAYGEISAFERLAEDSKLAPCLEDKLALAGMAATEFGHFRRISERLRSLGADPMEAMSGFVEALDGFHERTAPSDWYEGLIKAYVGEGLVADFYREIAAFLDVETRTLIIESLNDADQASFAIERIRDGIAADPRLGGRLALFGRRLMGEALSQAQRVAAERDALTGLLIGGVDRPGMDLAAIGRLFNRLTENHTQRMEALGLHA
ncbi:MAG TPA: ferritin-like fold-containing protein [Nocardioidaceae bacterium]|nr:ferritin-like fold-containing protein [Nocardioidaceae bacterium]